ncbi:MAG TPA: shikimate kinase [Holophaga sp.]|nr:shikimate kinase [Holophaga sp.]
MLNLPPVCPVTDPRLPLGLEEQVARFGAAGAPLVGFQGGDGQGEALARALAASEANGGWPAVCLVHASPDLAVPRTLPELGPACLDARMGAEALRASCAGLRSLGIAPVAEGEVDLAAAEACFRAGAESLLISGAPEALRGRLWKAQRLRWRCRPPLRKGQGVALVGGSGSGKSTLARELGACLGLPVQDLDDVIARRAGKPIPRIFAEDGEPAFRALESDITCEAFRAPAVLALGGGAWEDEAVRRAARASGFALLWIAEDPGRVWRRIAQDPGRPLAQERAVFLGRWRARTPRWMEVPMVLPLGRTMSQVARALGASLAS